MADQHSAGANPDEKGYLLRLSHLAELKARQARQVRNADNTARGELAAGEADLDAAAIDWALRQLDPEWHFLDRFFGSLGGSTRDR